MGVPQQLSPPLKCQLRVIQAKNIDPKSTKTDLFVRYHLSPAPTNKRITLNTHPTSSYSNTFHWDSSFSLECFGSHDSMHNLMHQSVVFELRSRKSTPFLGKLGGSQLLGRAQVPWRDVLESPNMEIDKWVLMGSSSRAHVDQYGCPLLKIQMKVEVPSVAEAKMERRMRYERLKKNECCGGCQYCQHGGCNNCIDYEIFALTAAFDEAL